MISNKMSDLVKNSSIIRAMFEEGKKMALEYGADNVYDFSLGNPNLAAPQEVADVAIDILMNENPLSIHGYMNNAGYEETRQVIASHVNKVNGTAFDANNIIMTVGAAGGLNVILKTLLNPMDEVMVIAPFFSEYRNYVANYDGNLVVVGYNSQDFSPDIEDFANKISKTTKAVIINSPNNPTGVVYAESTIIKIADLLRAKQKEYGTQIYLISDEPYRELVYDGVDVPYLTKYYDNTIVAYSYSKSLSLPGERIGYLVIPNQVEDSEDIINAANTANRILGYVNAPSLFQKVVARLVDHKVNVDFYNNNRELMYNGLKSLGYECIKPQGAFYLFLRSPEEDEVAFCKKAKAHRIIMVPGSSFACPGYVRVAYCVSPDTIKNSMAQFKRLADSYGLI